MSSLRDDDGAYVANINVASTLRPSDSCSKTFSADILGTRTDFALINYSNRIFVLATSCRKIGNIFQVCINTPQKNSVLDPGPRIFEVRCLFGEESEEKIVAVRSLAERLDVSRNLLISLTISNFGFNTISEIAKVILENRVW